MAAAPGTAIHSVSEALELVQGLRDFFGEKEWRHHKFPFGLWFRGHARVCESLEPRAFRTKVTFRGVEDVGDWDETNVYDVLRLRLPLQRRTYQSAFEWLCLMQHYSLPTRLLDWSESILVALYFTVNDALDQDGELFVLNAKRLNRLSKPHPTISTPSGGHVVIRAEMATTRSARQLTLMKTVRDACDEEGIVRTDGWMSALCKPIAVFPYRLNERMTLQSSVFTLHGGKHYARAMKLEYENDSIPPPVSLTDLNEKCPQERQLLKRYWIPGGDTKRQILEELFVLGIHEGSLFPEVERQVSYLEKLWWYSEPPESKAKPPDRDCP